MDFFFGTGGSLGATGRAKLAIDAAVLASVACIAKKLISHGECREIVNMAEMLIEGNELGLYLQCIPPPP